MIGDGRLELKGRGERRGEKYVVWVEMSRNRGNKFVLWLCI